MSQILVASTAVPFPRPDALPLYDVKLSEDGGQMTEDGYFIRLGPATASLEVRCLRRA